MNETRENHQFVNKLPCFANDHGDVDHLVNWAVSHPYLCLHVYSSVWHPCLPVWHFSAFLGLTVAITVTNRVHVHCSRLSTVEWKDRGRRVRHAYVCRGESRAPAAITSEHSRNCWCDFKSSEKSEESEMKKRKNTAVENFKEVE